MKKNYPYMLSPLKVGNRLLKNRLLSSFCPPSFISGPEKWVPEGVMTFFENLARAGAAYITVRDQQDDTSKTPMKHSPWWPIEDPLGQNYFSQLAERIHFQGSVVTVMVAKMAPAGYDVSETELLPGPGLNPTSDIDTGRELAPDPMQQQIPTGDEPPKIGPHGFPMLKEMTKEQIRESIDAYVESARKFQAVGFDGISVHAAYRGPLPAKFLSKATNHRTDEYGGSTENRARYLIELFTAIRQACGKDFIIEMEMSAEEPEEGGNTLEENIEIAKMLEGLVDIIQLRHSDVDMSHPTGYTWDGNIPHTLGYAQAFKNAGVKAVISPSGGFGDFDVIEDAISSGKCDAVDMARAFIVDPDYARKAAEGRADDRIPCIGCNKCHSPQKNKWVTVCSVNPMLGLAQHRDAMVKPAVRQKHIAVIGGGPAGMRAAIFSRERGHIIDLYERSCVLGGQLTHADYPSFKWPLKNFKDYLIRQVEKDEGITIYINTDATPEMISGKGYDAVIVAIGSEPVIPPMEGADSTPFYTPIGVYGHEPELGHRVVVVGGSDSGTETGMYLAETGHDVAVLTRQPILAVENQGVHFYSTYSAKWQSYPNFRGITLATTTKIEPGKVTYTDKDGEHVLECDSIVLSGGVKKDDALVAAFSGCAPEVVAAGDCVKPGCLVDVNFTAYSAACRL